MDDKRFALLIDSDNVSAKYISAILDEMVKYGVTTYKRIYGDWTSPQSSKWKTELLANSIIPIQQFSNTSGKNATDSALIIDAMDILYTSNVDGFCIVSSDSDFTRLASRLRESGMIVIGMGEEKTPRSFRAACSIFKRLDILVDSDRNENESGDENQDSSILAPSKGRNTNKSGNAADSPDDSGEILDKSDIENMIISIINENEDMAKPTSLSDVGNRLILKHPDFDVRNYGYNSLNKFLEEDLKFELQRTNRNIFIKPKISRNSRSEISSYVYAQISRKSPKSISINELSNLLHTEYPDFNVKDFGYSQFSKFVMSINGVEVYEDRFKRKRAKLENQ